MVGTNYDLVTWAACINLKCLGLITEATIHIETAVVLVKGYRWLYDWRPRFKAIFCRSSRTWPCKENTRTEVINGRHKFIRSTSDRTPRRFLFSRDSIYPAEYSTRLPGWRRYPHQPGHRNLKGQSVLCNAELLQVRTIITIKAKQGCARRKFLILL